MKSLCIAVSVAGLLLGASPASATTFAKAGAYTLVAKVTSVGYSQCPYTVAAQNLAGYTAFTGFNISGSKVTLKKNWVIAISPASSAEQKYAYTLGEPKPVASGQKLTFNGTVTYGNAADQFSAKTGTYNLTVDATTLASTLKVKGPNCDITYSITFTRGIPAKFLNLL